MGWIGRVAGGSGGREGGRREGEGRGKAEYVVSVVDRDTRLFPVLRIKLSRTSRSFSSSIDCVRGPHIPLRGNNIT